MSQPELPVFTPLDLAELSREEAVESLVRAASRMQASDLYFLSEEDRLVVAVRRWGIVREIASVPPTDGRHFISLVKASAGMDIAERRRPMDGRWIYETEDKRLDLRINSIPTLFGEDLTLRLLDRRSELRLLEGLGMTRSELNNLIAMLNNPSGLVLVSGPTGAGKTTTLYACLQYLNDGRRKINTLEDPIEYSIEGVRQSQIASKIGLDFPELLRSVLRQSPDVIMIGEIRDSETAATAVRAANSGHLVFSTLHAPIAAGAVQSMLALGAHPHFLASSLVGVIAQRLVRTLCPKCRVAIDLTDAPLTFEEVKPLLEPDQGGVMYGPGGCEECNQEGYSGRTGVFELMSMNGQLRKLITQDRPARELEQKAIEMGMIAFRRAALLKVARGITSIEEILRAVPSEYLGIEN